MQAVCSGFVYALALADKMVATGAVRNALVVGAEIYSRILDWNDRGTCVLFGDGAGAVVLLPSATPGILSTHLHADGSHRRILEVPGQVPNGVVDGHAVRDDGRARGVQVRGEGAGRGGAAKRWRRTAMTGAAIDWLIPHQANIRIMDATAKKLGLPHGEGRRDASTGTATRRRRRFRSRSTSPCATAASAPGQHVMLAGVGGGFTWGSVFLRW